MSVLFVVVIIAGTILSFFAEKSVRKKLLQQLLFYKSENNSTAYFDLLNTWLAHLYFSEKTRLVMETDYYLSYENKKQLKMSVNKLLSMTKVNQDVLVELMKVYIYYLEKDQCKEALDIEDQLYRVLDPKNNQEIIKEISLLHGIYITHDVEIAEVLKNELEHATEPQNKMVLMYRLAKLAEFTGDSKKAQSYLNQLSELSKVHIKSVAY